MMSEDYKNPDLGECHFSKRLTAREDSSKSIRIASSLLADAGNHVNEAHGEHIVLQQRNNRNVYVTARFFEDSRDILSISIQQYRNDSGRRHGPQILLDDEEAQRFIEIVEFLKVAKFDNEEKAVVPHEQLAERKMEMAELLKILDSENSDSLQEALRNEVTSSDVVAIGYRKNQLSQFDSLLNDADYFEEKRVELASPKGTPAKPEKVWQSFFEVNPWIFGYSLDFVFLSGVDPERLEQAVVGSAIGTHGKIIDALMKTRGYISTLRLVEIKTASTPLVRDKAIRSGCHAISQELADAVTQLQVTVDAAKNLLVERTKATEFDIYNYQPKSYLVIGRLQDFVEEEMVKKDKMKSFELFRQSLHGLEIITFDELFERASHIVDRSDK